MKQEQLCVIFLPGKPYGIHFIYLSLQIGNLKCAGYSEIILMQLVISAIQTGDVLKSSIRANIIKPNMQMIKHCFSVQVDQCKTL